MKALLTLPLAALLCGCVKTEPIVVSVPGDPHILHGTYTGTAGTAMLGEIGQTFPLTLISAATYVSPGTYKISGTLTFRDVTYTFQGEGTGQNGVTLRPQYTPVPEPSLSWEADLLVGGEKIGSLNGLSSPRSTTEQRGGLRVGEGGYLFTLDRR